MVHKDLTTLLPEIGNISKISINSASTRVAFLVDNSQGFTDGFIYIYCPDRQKIQIFDPKNPDIDPDESGRTSHTERERGGCQLI